MNSAHSIRKATVKDRTGVLSCLREAFEPYRAAYTPAGFLDTVLDDQTVLDRMREMCVLVAIDTAGAVVGTVGGAAHGGEGHLRGMAVLPRIAGSGVAQRLLETIESELRSRGCRRVTLDTTEPLQRAMRFYERNGYRRTGTVRDFFGMPLIEYAKDL